MKGVDVAIAALQSELGFLSGSIISHVQTAEMGNQSLNSLALIGARYTHTALEVLFQLASYYLFILCQALDLRARHRSFLASLKPEFDTLVESMLETLGHEEVETLKVEIWPRFQKELSTRTTLDSAHRIREAMIALRPLILGKCILCMCKLEIGWSHYPMDWSASDSNLSETTKKLVRYPAFPTSERNKRVLIE